MLNPAQLTPSPEVIDKGLRISRSVTSTVIRADDIQLETVVKKVDFSCRTDVSLS